MINLTEFVKAISSLFKGDGDYILLSNEEYKQLISESKPAVREEKNAALEQDNTTKTYKEVALGKPDQYDDPADIEISNTPVYYVPVGDNLYRPTYSKAVFCKHACYTLFKSKMHKAYCGKQFNFLLENGYHVYDLCLAMKLKERDALIMTQKENENLPPFILSAWERNFGEKCKWHPVKLLEDEKLAKQYEQDVKNLRKNFDNEYVYGDQTRVNFNYPPFIHHVSREFTNDPVDFKEYPNTLIVYTKNINGRGKPEPHYNINVIGEWMKKYAPKDKVPFKHMTDFNLWMKAIPLSAAAFWRCFNVKSFNERRQISIEKCKPVNDKFGFDLFDLNVALKKESKKEQPKSPDTTHSEPDDPKQELEYKVRRELVKERKFGIRTLSRLFSILECVATRQEVIDMFHIREEELIHPSDLYNATALEVNQFCHKQVCIGNIK